MLKKIVAGTALAVGLALGTTAQATPAPASLRGHVDGPVTMARYYGGGGGGVRVYSGRPAYSVRPGYVRPGYIKPGYVKPGYVKPGYAYKYKYKPGYYGYYGWWGLPVATTTWYGYSSKCSWLRHQARATGERYWWRRYRNEC